MKPGSKKTILLLVLAVCLVFSIATAETLIAIDLLHNCTHTSCRPCLRIEIMQGFLNALTLASLAFFAIGALVFFTETIQKHTKNNTYKLLSPIILKVRLNS